jgi:hypothetical protein
MGNMYPVAGNLAEFDGQLSLFRLDYDPSVNWSHVNWSQAATVATSLGRQ